jgi:hypothetical protein
MNEQIRRNVFAGDNQSLRGFVRMVEAEYPDEIVRIREPLDLRFDPTKSSGRDFAERLVISDEQRAPARVILESAGIGL